MNKISSPPPATTEPLEPVRRAESVMHDALAALGNVRRLIQAGEHDQAAKVADEAEEELVGEVFNFEEIYRAADGAQDAPIAAPPPASIASNVQGGEAASAPEPDTPPDRNAPTPAEFHEAVETMDHWSHWAFNKIESIAHLALLAMEAPKTFKNPDLLAEALHTIAHFAQDARGLINVEAEGVGADYKDKSGWDASRRRWDAMRAARGVQS
jgi:hypothetical protein